MLVIQTKFFWLDTGSLLIFLPKSPLKCLMTLSVLVLNDNELILCSCSSRAKTWHS